MQLNNTTNAYVDCVCPVSDVRAVFEVDASNIFPQGGLATIASIGSVLALKELQSTQDVSESSSLFSGSPCPVRVWNLLQSCWSGCHEDWAQAGSVLFKCVFFLLPTLAPLPEKGKC